MWYIYLFIIQWLQKVSWVGLGSRLLVPVGCLTLCTGCRFGLFVPRKPYMVADIALECTHFYGWHVWPCYYTVCHSFALGTAGWFTISPCKPFMLTMRTLVCNCFDYWHPYLIASHCFCLSASIPS